MDIRVDRNQQVANRIRAVMQHSRRYAFMGRSRLARDTGFSNSAITRLLSGRCRPSYDVALAVTKALEKEFGRYIPTRELISVDGRYPTPSICAVIGCRGCPLKTAFDASQKLSEAEGSPSGTPPTSSVAPSQEVHA